MPREVRERQMLDAAVAAFARHGYQAASMDDIAEAAGVSKPLVYLYLKSKEDLFMACVRREVGALVAAVREGTRARGLTADQQLWRGLTAFFAHTAARPDGVAVLYRARTQGEPFAREVAAMRVEVVAIVTALLGQAAKDAGCPSELAEREVSGLAHALVGAAESLAEWANSRTAEHFFADEAAGSTTAPSAKETAATLMNFCWAGLENLMKGARWTPAPGPARGPAPAPAPARGRPGG
ncbi:TetR/AcrR family transcriptional regulator [Streptomyces spirodelae]|uniref:TetR/AcrR family transcriptional regulator n=1 Tax=Streptomyces spirodelae TaxID=2812904 RepID=A0ABS3WYZ6_9ACTN|nr:TetR/AcrR family transcriptional regulator [Streptomyces spirodelae]MBO8188283.1 TetR/AcrR family transcriptional regulator [Streptomyces spirodelae]